ncbi:aminotransferase-like domain-containing protein [Blastococcus sp. SYSU D00820]
MSSTIRDLLAVTARPEIVSLAGGLPAEAAIPVEWLGECAAVAARSPGGLQYSLTEGDPELRELLAGWESTWLGRPVTAPDVLVTTGSQQALDLLARALLDPGDPVVVEDPAYIGALQAFTAAGAHLTAVPQDRDGMRTPDLEARLRGGLRPKLVYVTPTFHNPAGSTLPDHRRRHLAALADRYGFLVVEDDAYRLLPFDGEPPSPVAAHTERAAHLGTFSKILSPGLRVGWLTAPRPVLAAMTRIKQAADLHTSTFAQVVLREAGADARRLQDHVGALRRLYRGRAEHLVTALASAFGDRLSIGTPAGGMFCWAEFLDGTDTSALLPTALQRGVAFVPGTAFSVAGAQRHALRLCFASVPGPVLNEGVRRLAAAGPAR